MLKWKNYIYSLHANRLKLNLALKVPIFLFNGDHHYKTTVSNYQILLVWVFLSFLVLFFLSKQAHGGFLKACICDLIVVPGLTVIYSQRLTQVITVMLMMENRDVPLTLPWCICKWATAKWIKGEGCNEVSEAYDGVSSLAYYPLNLRMSDGKL